MQVVCQRNPLNRRIICSRFAIRRGYESDIHLRLSQQLQVQEADHSQEIEKTEEEEGRKAACGFG